VIDKMEELPDRIFVILGKRGLHPINLKACVKCLNSEPFVLGFIEKKGPLIETMEHTRKETTDYKVRCKNCNTAYIIRQVKLVQIETDEEIPIVITFNILDENGNDEGWLGSVYF